MTKPTQKICTLLFLRRGDEILLAMKKRGFGAGHWNGAGGKIEPGETIEQALIRECEEEIGVTPTEFDQVARHHFIFQGDTPDIVVHAFIAEKWQGEPKETEEMAPQWFKLHEIPYAQMWDDDKYWLPAVLAGDRLVTHFQFAADDKTVSAVAMKRIIPFDETQKGVKS